MSVQETEVLLRLQTEVLEAVARGGALRDIARLLCRKAEDLSAGVFCSILLVDSQKLLRPLAAPSLPDDYSAALDGLPIGPKVGSCGTSAFRNEPVIVTDIATDPLWDDFRQLALPLGLWACWSSPIRDREDRIVGTFAFYYDEPRGPTEFERRIVDTCVHLFSLAIRHEQVSERNQRLAYFDVLTGLPNRRQFNEVLAHAIDRTEPFGIILVDIDNLKLINDSVGHSAGDALIRAVATRMNSLAEDLMPCRLGGDEFAVLVHNCPDHAGLRERAGYLHAAIQGMVSVGDQSIDPHVTMGGAIFGTDGVDADTLVQNADFALHRAKQSHRGGYLGFRLDLRTDMVQRIAKVRQVDQALVEGRVLAHYQPIVRLDTGEVIGVEALARIRLPDGRIATAGEFHAAFSDPRIAYEMTGHMLDAVASDVRSWLDAKLPFQHVGFNVTTGDFRRGNLADRVAAAFQRARVPLNHIVLEVNEAVFMGGSDNVVPRAVEALRSQGILVALDDFGTGYASLTHLLSFPVDIIKIDRSFVSPLPDHQPSEVVVSAILDIARKLGMRVVAEGIESSQQADELRAMGCKLGQGFLFSRAVSAQETARLLKTFGQRSKPRATRTDAPLRLGFA